jgi:hypothetical protein
MGAVYRVIELCFCDEEITCNVEIVEGTHTVIMEKNRMMLFREVQLFLDKKHQAAK